MANRFVRKLVRLSNIDAEGVAALESATAHSRRLDAKMDLIREGDRTGSVFVMLEGWAHRYRMMPNGARQIVAFLMPGDACDLHDGMLTEMDHSIQTVTASRVASISGHDMERMMRDHTGIARAMYIAQLNDDRLLRSWIVSMSRLSSMQRVAHLICELYIRARMIGLTYRDEFEFPLSQVVLADALGMTPVHINRVLRHSELAEAMWLTRGLIKIINPDKLAGIAGFEESYLQRQLAY